MNKYQIENGEVRHQSKTQRQNTSDFMFPSFIFIFVKRSAFELIKCHFWKLYLPALV